MYAVIMAGGRGTRVASVSSSVPKPMLPIAGKPVLQHQIECLKRQGIDHIILTVSHLGDQIQNYFGNGSAFGLQMEYIQEDAPLGTAGALYYLRGRLRDDFFLINGDLIFDVDLDRMNTYHRASGAAVTLMVHPNDHPFDSGIILADINGQVRGWLSKEDERGWYKNCVNAGIHILSPRLLETMEGPQKMDLDRQILKPLLQTGELYAYHSTEYVKDMGTPERIADVERDLRAGLVERKNLTRRQRAVFLDRDGTINRFAEFLTNIDDFILEDGAAEAIQTLNRSGWLAIVVTNQPVIARGELSWAELDMIHNKMETLLGQQGAYVDDIFVCPHHPDKGFKGEVLEYKIECGCRKPKPGLLLQAAEKYNIDLSESWMIGDKPRDEEAGRAAGCRTVRLTSAFNLKNAVDKLSL